MGVSLIQSNAGGFGAGIAEPSTGIFLQNRGIGFSLEPGHPAEYGPRRRPPHTLSPALVTSGDALEMVIGTMGGDSQPQILLQLLTRMLANGADAGDAIAAGRWGLTDVGTGGGFSTWNGRGDVAVVLEETTPHEWETGLRRRGHRVTVTGGNYGHAHVIAVRDDTLEGAADPRALTGAAAAW